jgi:hypothetical protein
MALAMEPVLAAGQNSQPGTSQDQSGMSGSGMSGSSRTGINSTFSDLDKNGDGQISKQEAQDSQVGGDQLTQHWNRYDINQDDQLDRGEFAAFEAAQPSGGSGMGNQGQGSQPGEQQSPGSSRY